MQRFDSFWTFLTTSSTSLTVFQNQRKNLIQHLRLHFEWTKVHQKCQNWSFWRVFEKPETCCQTLLPDRSISIRQKRLENAKMKNSNAIFWVNFKNCVLSCKLQLAFTFEFLDQKLRFGTVWLHLSMPFRPPSKNSIPLAD